jgi:hypothetical protein
MFTCHTCAGYFILLRLSRTPSFISQFFVVAKVATIQKIIESKFGCAPDMKGFLIQGSFYVFGYLLEHIISIWRFGNFLIKIK